MLHAPEGSRKRKRVKGRGRGTGKGKTAGRGHKGQNSRAGGGVRLGFEGGQMPLYRRLARRGFSNYPFKKTYVAVNLADLEAKFESGDTVSLASLKQKGIVKNSVSRVKILGTGEVTKKLVIEGLPISASAKGKIAEAGGSTGPGGDTSTTLSTAESDVPSDDGGDAQPENASDQDASRSTDEEQGEQDGE